MTTSLLGFVGLASSLELFDYYGISEFLGFPTFFSGLFFSDMNFSVIVTTLHCARVSRVTETWNAGRYMISRYLNLLNYASYLHLVQRTSSGLHLLDSSLELIRHLGGFLPALIAGIKFV